MEVFYPIKEGVVVEDLLHLIVLLVIERFFQLCFAFRRIRKSGTNSQ